MSKGSERKSTESVKPQAQNKDVLNPISFECNPVSHLLDYFQEFWTQRESMYQFLVPSSLFFSTYASGILYWDN